MISKLVVLLKNRYYILHDIQILHLPHIHIINKINIKLRIDA
jgi:hypothetical protein